jgi:enoyl reductase-like protein
MKKLWFLTLTSLLAFTGCQTSGVMLRETPLNVSETRRAVVSVIGQPRITSENGRELFSNYYDRKGHSDEKSKSLRERLHTHVTVLGDRRPYDIQIEVVVEIRDQDGAYQVVEQDDARAEKIALDVQKALVQSRDNRNIIDDFRPY